MIQLNFFKYNVNENFNNNSTLATSTLTITVLHSWPLRSRMRSELGSLSAVLAVSARGHIEYYLYGLSKYWVLEIPMSYAVFCFNIDTPFRIKQFLHFRCLIKLKDHEVRNSSLSTIRSNDPVSEFHIVKVTYKL